VRDVYLWTGYGLGGFVAGRLIVALVRRCIDVLDRRTATAPTVFHTDVWLPPADVGVRFAPPVIQHPRHSIGDDTLVIPVGSVRVPGWVLKAPADEQLAEFAGPTHAAVAQIWADLDGLFTAKGLRTA